MPYIQIFSECSNNCRLDSAANWFFGTKLRLGKGWEKPRLSYRYIMVGLVSLFGLSMPCFSIPALAFLSLCINPTTCHLLTHNGVPFKTLIDMPCLPAGRFYPAAGLAMCSRNLGVFACTVLLRSFLTSGRFKIDNILKSVSAKLKEKSNILVIFIEVHTYTPLHCHTNEFDYLRPLIICVSPIHNIILCSGCAHFQGLAENVWKILTQLLCSANKLIAMTR